LDFLKTFLTKGPLRFVTYLSKVPKIAKKNFFDLVTASSLVTTFWVMHYLYISEKVQNLGVTFEIYVTNLRGTFVLVPISTHPTVDVRKLRNSKPHKYRNRKCVTNFFLRSKTLTGGEMQQFF
jgi:hypothetical protein